MKYYTNFYYDDEGDCRLLMSSSDQKMSLEEFEKGFTNPHYFLENATYELWDLYNANVDSHLKPSNRQREMIKKIIDKDPKMILQFVPSVPPEEFDSQPLPRKADGRTIKNLWSRREYMANVAENKK